MKQMEKSIQYIILTCIISWVIAGAVILFKLHEIKGISTVFNVGYMFLPMICAIIHQLVHKEKPFTNSYISFRFNRWFIIAGIVPIIFLFIAFGVNLLFPNVSLTTNYEYIRQILPGEQVESTIEQLSRYSLNISILIQIGQALIFGFTISAIFAFGEELGWRGYLLKTLQGKKLFPVSLIIGFVWGVWHFPLILMGHNYPLHPVAGIGMMTIICILLTPLMIYIVIKSKTVITAAIFHGTMNAFGGITIFYLSGGNDLTNGLTGIAGFIALLIVNFMFYLFDKFVTKENYFTKII